MQRAWVNLEPSFDPLFLERRFDIQVVDKATQYTTLTRKKTIKAIELLLTKKRSDIEKSDNAEWKELLSSSTAERIRETLKWLLTEPGKP